MIIRYTVFFEELFHEVTGHPIQKFADIQRNGGIKKEAVTIDTEKRVQSATTLPDFDIMAAAENSEKLKRIITEQDQRVIIKWRVIQGPQPKFIVSSINNWPEFSKRNMEKWVRMFKEGRTETSEGRGGAHNAHSAHEERVAEIKRRIAERRDWTIVELARETGIPATPLADLCTKN
uniref:Transposase n=1 Tax=Haemonchus contortus TaxID=6289 RepID=A0A7I4Z4K0_HAECO|nr:unnamed protein product [Haemonchus contortus]